MSPFKELIVVVSWALQVGVMVTLVLHNCSCLGVHMLSIFNYVAP